MFLGAWPIRLGAPGIALRRWVSIGAVPVFLGSRDTTFLGPLPPGPDGDPHAANLQANRAFAEMMQPTQDRLVQRLQTLGAGAPPRWFGDASFDLPDAFAALTVAGFEFHRSDAPESLHLVGPLPLDDPPSWEPPEWWGALDAGRPLAVVVTQGTIANDDLSRLVEPTIRALGDRDVTVVAA